MVQLNGFAVNVISRNATTSIEKDAFFVTLDDMSEYSLELFNNNQFPASATVYIDDEKIGKFLVEPSARVVVSRPVDQDRKFIFMSENNSDAVRNGIIWGKETNGLIKVVFQRVYQERQIFTPQVISPRRYSSGIESNSARYSVRDVGGVTAGATVLGSETGTSYDAVYGYVGTGNETIIMIRLQARSSRRITPYPGRPRPSGLPTCKTCGGI